MRESNFRNIPLNKAAVSITTNLYDRRALDTTLDQPLVNSLNHLTFLTSSSAKVRETLTTDGGIERLVSIMNESHKDPECTSGMPEKKTIEIEKMNALIAWKWTLAFQCLVLVATRGTERIRKRVIEAGVLPIISTVLDNYLLFMRNFDNELDDSMNEKFLTVVATKLHKMKYNNTQEKVRTLDSENPKDYSYFNITNFLSPDCKIYRYLGSYICPQGCFSDQEENDDPLEIDEALIKKNMHSINETITCPRSFLNGKLIPKDDDVVWSLQLLAFTTKYSNLKSFFQNTQLVEALSLRSLISDGDDTGKSENKMIDDESEMIENIDPVISRSKSKDVTNDYDMIYMDSNNLASSSIGSSQQSAISAHTSSQPALTQSLTQSISQQPFSQKYNSSTFDSSVLTPITQNFQQPFHPQQASIPSSTLQPTETMLISKSIMNHEDDLNDENLDPNLTNHLSKVQSSSTSTSSSLYGTSVMDDESMNASTLPSTICEDHTKFNPNSIGIFSQPKEVIIQNNDSNELVDASLVNSIIKLENHLSMLDMEQDDDGTNLTMTSLVEVCQKLNNYYEKSLSSHKIKSMNESKLATRKILDKYNYETYFSSKNQELESNSDRFNQSPSSTKRISCFEKFKHQINLFPLVEKFTMKSINTADMCYWAGVVMRNSCRKDEERGGVRQCAYHGCGKWEAFPRQFAKCRRCKRTKYCSKECQLKAWGYHKHWCVDSSTASSGTVNTGNATTTTVPSTAVGAPTPNTDEIDDNNLGAATSDVLNETVLGGEGQFINRLDGGVSEEN